MTGKQLLGLIVAQIAICTIAIVAILAHSTQAAPAVAPAANTSAYMPVVLNQVAPITPTLTTLLTLDSTFVDAKADPASGRIFLAVIVRADHNRLHIFEDIGPKLVEATAPEIRMLFAPINARGPPADAPAPAFTFVGDKQAAGMILFYGGYFRVYFTGRDDGDTTGPFRLKRLITNIPPASTP